MTFSIEVDPLVEIVPLSAAFTGSVDVLAGVVSAICAGAASLGSDADDEGLLLLPPHPANIVTEIAIAVINLIYFFI